MQVVVGSIVFVLSQNIDLITPGVLSEIIRLSDLDGEKLQYRIVFGDGVSAIYPNDGENVFLTLDELENKLMAGATSAVKKILFNAEKRAEQLFSSESIDEKLRDRMKSLLKKSIVELGS